MNGMIHAHKNKASSVSSNKTAIMHLSHLVRSGSGAPVNAQTVEIKNVSLFENFISVSGSGFVRALVTQCTLSCTPRRCLIEGDLGPVHAALH